MKRAEWNKLAEEFETQVCDVTRTDKSKQLQRLVSALRLSKKNSVLVDLGCGLGTFIQQFGDRFQKIVGLDFAPRMVERAQELVKPFPDITWLAMDGAAAAARFGASADLVVCLNVITSPSAARRKGLWANVAAVAKPRGHVLVVVPSLESSHMVHLVEHGKAAPAASKLDGHMERDGVTQKHYTRRELDQILAANGLTPKRITKLYYPWSEEGLPTPRSRGAGNPFDWVIVAQRLPPARRARAAAAQAGATA